MATVGRLSLKVAHEVRNPIAAIELNAEMLGDIVQEQRGAEDGRRRPALVSAIRDQVSALDALTEEYLAFARFPRPQFEEDSVNDMVQAVAEFVRPLATRQGHHGRAWRPIPTVPADGDRPHAPAPGRAEPGQERAGGAVPAAASVTITTACVGDTVEIAVSRQRARGISPEVGRRLFEQFFTTKPQGTGLGLSISRQIVEEHGGEIRWHSAPGAGATFTIAAARQESRPCLSPPAARDPPGRRRRSRRAPEPRAHADARGLSRWCWPPTARPRSSGCRRAGVDLVLSDLKMPGLTGLELLREAKAVAPDVDVILLTAFGTVEEAVQRDEGRRHRLPHQAVPARAAHQGGAPGPRAARD